MVNRLLQQLEFRLFPGHCVLCGDASQDRRDIWNPCRESLPRRGPSCRQCALPLPEDSGKLCGHCQLEPPPFQRSLSCWDYQPPLSYLIGGYKYHRQFQAGRVLAELATPILRQQLAGREPPHYLVATPMHWRRRWQRSFNHSEQLSRYFAKALNIPLLTGRKRVRPTPAQQSLTAAERRRNLKGAFRFDPTLSGEHVAVVDDVMTTGATAAAISDCLLEAGAGAVEIWCLARTPVPR